MISYGLKNIYLVNTANFGSENISLDKSALFIGNSGVGKSTIMRACAFFYTMDYNKIGIDMNSGSKQTFVDWHFKANSSSHIIYEYNSEYGKFLLVLSRKERLRYTFVDISEYEDSVLELFFNESDDPINFDAFEDKIKMLKMDYFSTQKKDEYKKVLCKDEYRRFSGEFKSKLNGVKYYLFSSKTAAETYGEYVSKIFLNVKVSENNIKDIITKQINYSKNGEDENAFAAINIEELKNSFEDLLQQSKDIKIFNALIPQIESTEKNVLEYNHLKKEKKDSADKILKLYDRKDEVLEKLDSEISSNKSILEKCSQDYDAQSSSLIAKKTETSADLKTLEKELKNTIEKKEYFERKKITEIIELDKKEVGYQDEANTLSSTIALLNSTAAEEKNTFEQTKNRIKEEITDSFKDTEKHIDKKIDSLNDDARKVYSEEKKATSENLKTKEEADILAKKITKKENSITLKQTEIGGIVKSRLESDESLILKSKIGTANEELKEYDSKIEITRLGIQRLLEEKRSIGKNYSDELLHLKKAEEDETEKLTQEIIEINEQLNLGRNNIYGYINKTNHPYKTNISKVLSREVLFTELNEEIESNLSDNTLYGLNIPLQDFENKYDPIVLENKKKSLKDKIKLLEVDIGKKISNLEKDVKRKNSEIDNTLKRLNGEDASLKSKKNRCESNITSLKECLEKEEVNLQREKDDELFNIKTEITRIRDSIEIERPLYELKLKEFKDQKEVIKNSTAEQERKINNEISMARKEKENIHAQRDTKINETIKRLKDNFLETLKQKGTDINSLKNAENKKREIESQLKAIKDNKELIFNYNAIKQKFEDIPLTEKEIESLSKKIEDISSEIADAKKIYDIEVKKHNEIETTFVTKKQLVINFVKNVDKFFIGDDFEDENNFLKYEFEKVYNSINEFESIVDYHDGLLTNIEALEKTLIRDIRKICKRLSPKNKLNLKVIDDSYEYEDIHNLLNIFSKYLKTYQIDYCAEGNDSIFKNIRETLSNYATTLLSIKDRIDNMKSNVDLINRVLYSGVQDIQVIDKIEIEFKKENNAIVEALEKLIDYSNKNSEIYIAEMMTDNNDRVYDEMLEHIDELVNEVNYSKRITEISLSDLISIEFVVGENGTERRMLSLSDIGSNGTGILVRTIMYISLLEIAAKKAQISENQMFHCILDEIGQVSENYFSELLKFTEKRNFMFINGMPIIADEIVSLYPTVYTGVIEGNRSIMYDSTIGSI